MSKKVITLTGGSGYVGQILQHGLKQRGYRVVVFDQLRGPLVNLLRQTYLGTSTSPRGVAYARRLKRFLGRLERALVKTRVLRPSWDNILDLRSRLAERFRSSDAVVHLAALPHPKVPGAAAADYQRINYEASVNVFEAARDAGVPKFIFASSGQVYGINKPVRIDQFPILESNYCPTLEDGQSMYGFLKVQFEEYLAGACAGPGIQAIALRLECPGVRSTVPGNFYISTSIENVVAGFACALAADLGSGFEAFNLVDRAVDERIVDIQEFIKKSWPNVPNYTKGNECLLSTEKACSRIGYNPISNGTYNALSVLW